jgi:hypothetical protein
MNERIELDGDMAVRIMRREPCRPPGTILAMLENGCLNLVQDGWFDAAGRDALIEALSCLRDTKSFAALADTSAVPYVGKQLLCVSGIPEVPNLRARCTVVTDAGDGDWWVYAGGHRDELHKVEPRALSALVAPPPKRIRPYTPSELIMNWDRKLKAKFGHCVQSWEIGKVGRNGVMLDYGIGPLDKPCELPETFDGLLRAYVWADNGEPCGVVES